VELGQEGLESIRVRIDEGTDEASVLDEIRRILVAYGLKSRRDDRASADVAFAYRRIRRPAPAADHRRPPRRRSVRSPHRGRAGRRTTGERSPIGVAEAMVRPSPSGKRSRLPYRLALAWTNSTALRSSRCWPATDGRTAVSAASCAVSLAGGIYQAATGVLAELDPPI
jgi:hypothetical protein